jgi:hypothetical protein
MRRKTVTRYAQGEGDYESTRRHLRGLKRYLETHDPEADARRAVPRAIAEAGDLEIAEAAGRRRMRGAVECEYARGARRRSAPTTSP